MNADGKTHTRNSRSRAIKNAWRKHKKETGTSISLKKWARKHENLVVLYGYKNKGAGWSVLSWLMAKRNF